VLFKLVSLAMLVVAAWPLPVMLAHNSPDGYILGLYDTTYFALLAAYLIVTIGWGIFTAWTLARLGQDRLALIRGFVSARSAFFTAAFGLVLATMLAVHYVIWVQLIGLPGDIYPILKVTPVVVAGLLSLLFGILQTGGGPQLPRWLAARPALKALARWRYELALAAITIIFGMLVISPVGMFIYPLSKDASAHLYIGQRLLAGGVPYRDVLYFHPPLRFVVSALWAAVAQLTDLPPVETARALNLLLVIPWLLATYHIARNLTGERFTGVLAVLLTMGTGILFDRFGLRGPNLKFEISLALVTSIWAAQRQRWGWAGVLSACAAMMWLPAGLSTAGLLLAALLNEEPLNWKSAFRLSLGAGAVVAILASWLLASGTLVAAFQQTVLAALSVAGSSASDLSTGSKVLNIIQYSPGGWVNAVLMGLGLVYLLVYQLPRQWRQSATSAFILGTLPLVFVMYTVDVVSSGDLVIVLILVSVSAAVALHWLLKHLPSRQLATDWAAIFVVSLLVVEFGHRVYIDSVPLSAVDTLSEQQAMAVTVDRVLGVGGRIQCFDNQWLAVMTWRDNVLPVIQIRPKGMVSNTLAGWSAERIVRGLEQEQPDIIIVGRGPDPTVEAYITEHYIPVGQLQVRPDYDRIEELRAIWAEN
jgi:hypothetical protein